VPRRRELRGRRPVDSRCSNCGRQHPWTVGRHHAERTGRRVRRQVARAGVLARCLLSMLGADCGQVVGASGCAAHSSQEKPAEQNLQGKRVSSRARHSGAPPLAYRSAAQHSDTCPSSGSILRGFGQPAGRRETNTGSPMLPGYHGLPDKTRTLARPLSTRQRSRDGRRRLDLDDLAQGIERATDLKDFALGSLRT
jgi:hypothetical protein